MIQPATLVPASNTNRRQQPNDNKSKAQQSASNNWQVATVEDLQPAGQPGPKLQQRGKGAWQPAFFFQQALDAPCKFHSSAKPSNHTTPKCNYLARITKGEALPPPLLGGQASLALQ